LDKQLKDTEQAILAAGLKRKELKREIKALHGPMSVMRERNGRKAAARTTEEQTIVNKMQAQYDSAQESFEELGAKKRRMEHLIRSLTASREKVFEDLRVQSSDQRMEGFCLKVNPKMMSIFDMPKATKTAASSHDVGTQAAVTLKAAPRGQQALAATSKAKLLLGTYQQLTPRVPKVRAQSARAQRPGSARYRVDARGDIVAVGAGGARAASLKLCM
jgi:hypothetical protein